MPLSNILMIIIFGALMSEQSNQFSEDIVETYTSEALEKIKEINASKGITLNGEKEALQEQEIFIKLINRYDDPNYKKKTCVEHLESIKRFIEAHKFSETEKMLELTSSTKSFYRVFFDIEGNTNEEQLQELIKDFKEYVLKEYHMKCEEAWTQNVKSVHGEYSYHLFFNIYTNMYLMPFVITGFDIFTKFKYHNSIDKCVYNFGRLFRMPFSYRPQQKPLKEGDGRDILSKDDYHDIKKGSLEDCLISNIKGCHKIIPEYITPVAPLPNDRNTSEGQEILKMNDNDKEKAEEQILTLSSIKERLAQLQAMFK